MDVTTSWIFVQKENTISLFNTHISNADVDDMDRENLNNVVQLETPTQMHFNAI